MRTEKKAYITILCTNNYIHACIGLMYSWQATNPKYPFYCLVTDEITSENIKLLEDIGYKVLKDQAFIPDSYFKTLEKLESETEPEFFIGNATADLKKNGWQHAWTKLQIFKYTQFEKLLYIDADSYVVQNLDHLFDMPGWSASCEYDAPWTGLHRFHTAFFLAEPSRQIYDELVQLAEANPLIRHPQTGMLQLANDYDLLNLYKSDWAQHPECQMPSYTFVDSFTLRTSDYFLPFVLNCVSKVGVIHLTGPKPWLCGSAEIQNYGAEWGLWKELYLIYLKFLNNAIADLWYRGIACLSQIP